MLETQIKIENNSELRTVESNKSISLEEGEKDEHFINDPTPQAQDLPRNHNFNKEEGNEEEEEEEEEDCGEFDDNKNIEEMNNNQVEEDSELTENIVGGAYEKWKEEMKKEGCKIVIGKSLRDYKKDFPNPEPKKKD